MPCFILTPTYRVVRGVPEVHVYGLLESGEPCLLIDDRTAPSGGRLMSRPESVNIRLQNGEYLLPFHPRTE